MGIRLDELKSGGWIIRETVSETLIGECHSFAGYIEQMENAMLDPLDGMEREDFDIFTHKDDKRLISLYFDICEDCGEHLADCECEKNKAVCEHEFESIEGESFALGALGETVEKKVSCKHCGKIAKEVWIYSCTIDY